MVSSETARVFTASLSELAGPGAMPRPGQLEAVAALVEGRERVLVVQATGWGKSLVYWTATRLLRSAGAGPTVVISPLLALMRDQISAAARSGLVAVSVNSSNFDDWEDVFQSLRDDQVDVLLVSPERLANPKFADIALPLLARSGLLVIDEAHCISDWGFDFRPDYQRLTGLLLHLGQQTPVLATTATANARVTADVAAQLGPSTRVLRGPLARSSLQLSVVPGLSAVERFAWVDQALGHIDGSGIVYCPTVEMCDSLAEYLGLRGHQVAAYNSKTDPETRERIEDALRGNALKAVVATSALGMGYDKPDLAFCVHLGSPSSPVAYYQQVGRAGRQLDHALGVLLPAGDTDEQLWAYFATASLPDPQLAAAVLDSLEDGPKTLLDLEGETGGRRTRLEALLKQLHVDGAVRRDGSLWCATGEGWAYDQVKYDAVIAARRAEAGLMREYARGARCLMLVLIEALDDPAAQPCGRCSVCTGILPLPGHQPDPAAVRAAAAFLRSQTRFIAPRKLWPRGVTRSGKIVACSEGRAVAYANDPGWPELIAELEGPDAPPSPELVDALIGVLRDWRPPKPGAIAAVPDPTHPQRTAGIVEALSTRLRLPAIDALTWAGPKVPDKLASGAHVVIVEERLLWANAVDIPEAAILLVSATARSRWTLTVAAAMFREAGATDALPLVAHLKP